MKNVNLIIGIVIVAAIGVGAYIFLGKKSGVSEMGKAAAVASADAVVNYVPEDSFLFVGGLQPIALGNFVKPFKDMMNVQIKSMQSIPTDSLPPQLKFGMLTLTAWMQSITQDKPLQDFGMGGDYQAALYFVGGLPVLRIKLQDPAVFDKKIAELESKAGATNTRKELDGIAYRLYGMPKEGSGVVIATVGNWAVITIDFGDEKYNANLATALGKSKPKKTLAASGKLQQIISSYQFDPRMVGYIDHQAIASAIFDSQGSLGQSLKMLEEVESSLHRDMQNLRESGCGKDVNAIVANWPRTVIGYTKMDFDHQPAMVDSTAIIEVKDSATTAALAKLRGFIPMHVNTMSKHILDIGLGLDVDQLMPFVTQLSADIQKQNYTCPPLQEMQRNLAGPSLMGLGMMTGMVAGVKGVSASVMDLDAQIGSGMMPNINSLDALITITATDPAKLLSVAKQFLPVQALDVPADGTPVDLPFPVPMLKAPVKLAIKGSHLTAYTGSQAAAVVEKLNGESPDKNGLITIGMDYGKYMKLITGNLGDAMLQSGTDAETLKLLSEMNMQTVMHLDVNDKGIILRQKVIMP